MSNQRSELNQAIDTVLGLASRELCSVYEVARRGFDKAIEAQADKTTAKLRLVEPLLKAAPQLLEALLQLHDACEYWDDQDDPVLLNARAAIAEATRKATA